MGMPLEVSWVIVTDNKSKRIKENTFELEQEGYLLYPIDKPLHIKKKTDDKSFGSAIITKLEWSNGKTHICYELKELDTVN